MKLVSACLLVFMMLGVSSALAIDSGELPFGAYRFTEDYDATFLNRLDSLCFNYFAEYDDVTDGTKIDSLGQHEIMGIRGGQGTPPEKPFEYSWANYAAISVRFPYPNPEVRMVSLDAGGFYDNANDSCWVSPQGSQDTLSGFSTYTSEFDRDFMSTGAMQNRVSFFDEDLYGYPIDGKIRYKIKLHTKINNPDTLQDSVAVIRVKLGGLDRPCEMYTAFSYTLRVNEFLGDTLQWVEIDSFFTIPDNIWVKMDCDAETLTQISKGSYPTFNPFLNLEIATTGAESMAIDKVVIYDDAGKELMEPPYWHDEEITQKFEEYSSRADNIYGWFLMDEPLYANFLPIRHIDSLMQQVDTSWHVYTENWMVNRNYMSLNHSWFRIADQDYLCPDLYFFGEGQPYSGISYQGFNGPLFRCNDFHSWVRADTDEEGKKFWMILQAHESDYYTLRMPTISEFACQTFMSMAWGVQGLNYYFYKWNGYGDGFISQTGERTPLYFELRDHIGPYIQAVDEFYLPLVWDSCYVFTPTTVAPSGCYVNSISATSGSENPDIGWFQVGQFSDTLAGDTAYIMIVNRACNINDSTQIAPPITATVFFDRDNLDMGDNVLITDLANSIYYDNNIHQWQGTAKTTKARVAKDGTIPYKITLRAGEGKLIKIAKAPKK